MARPRPADESSLAAFLAAHPEWGRDQDGLVRTYEAPTFLDGIAFVDRVAALAEAEDHHPDIDIRWRRVRLRFVTHDAGNEITEIDLRLAAACDELFAARR